MSAGGYDVQPYPVDADDPTDISFRRQPANQDQPSTEQTEFACEAGRVLQRINALMAVTTPNFAEDARYREYFDRLLYAAQNGVQSNSGDLVQGTTALNTVKSYFISREGPRLRAKYLQRLHRATLTFSLLALVALLVLDKQAQGTLKLLGTDWQQPLQALAVAALGMCLATWAYRMFVHETLTWENLRQYGTAAYSPSIRYLMILALILASMLLLGKDVIQLQILSLDLASFETDPVNGVFLGLLAGLAEKRLTGAVMSAFAES